MVGADGTDGIAVPVDAEADTVDAVTTTGREGNAQPTDTDDPADAVRNYDSTEQMFTQRRLAAGTTNHYRIFAFTRSDTTDGASPLIMSVPSNEGNGSTDEPLHPGRTRNLEALASGRTTIDLTWEYPEVTDEGCVDDDTDIAREDDGSECPAESAGSVITGYQIQVSDNGTSGWTDLAVDTCLVLDKDGDPVKPRTMETPRCMYTHTDLEPDTTKYYRVFAMNVAGDGPLSNTALDTTHLSEFPDVPGGLTGDPYGATAVNLCWLAQSLDPADDPVMSYEITVSGMDDPIMVMAATMGDPVPTQHMVGGLMPKTDYTFEVRAVNMRGESNEAATETVTTADATVPGVPTGVTVVSTTATTIVASWTAPAEAGTSAITGYDVEYTAAGGTAAIKENCCTDLDVNIGANDSIVLTPATTYTLRVRATNASGDGAWSDAVEATTMAAAVDTTLGVPSGVTATPGVDDPGTVVLSWTRADNATTHTVAGVRRNADLSLDTINALFVPMADDLDGDGMYTVEMATLGLIPGEYIFGRGGWPA